MSGVFIQRDQVTVSSRENLLGAPAVAPDNEEAARTRLLHQIDTSSHELEGQLATLRNAAFGNHELVDDGVAKLHRLNLLRDQLVGGTKGVAALRAEIASAVAATRAYTSGISGAVGTAQGSPAEQAAQAALRDASIAAHRTVADFSRDFYERKIFDPYLKFASTEDEEAYRRREQERQRAIEKAQVENTPAGNLRANELAIDQLKDAGAHGADRSPDYKPRMDGLVGSRDALRSAVARNQAVATEHQGPSAPATGDAADPFASLKAKSPETAGAASVLLAAGLSVPHSDNVGHGVTNQAIQSAPPVRAI